MLRIDFYFSKLHLKTAHAEGRNIANLTLCSAPLVHLATAARGRFVHRQ